MRSVTINASKDYDVLVGAGLLKQSGEIIASACGGEAAFLLTDDVVNNYYGDVAEQSLRAAGYITSRFVFPHGEKSKNIDTYIALLRALSEANITRSDVVVALGGGVTGDLGGFSAATYLRGTRFAQIPTSLLAMVDSSVGGKTAIDLPTGKNQVGAFYQPDIVICDVDVIRALPNDIFLDGCAEIIKHGIILSAELFELLKQPIHPQLEDVIVRNIVIKRDIVVADERDAGIRRILNFGHTIGHGIEKLSGYTISHGKAVAIGMAVASLGSFRLGICNEDCYLEIIDMIKRFHLPNTTNLPPDELTQAAFYDKKRSGQHISLILPEKIGKCLIKSFSLADLASFIRLGTEIS